MKLFLLLICCIRLYPCEIDLTHKEQNGYFEFVVMIDDFESYRGCYDANHGGPHFIKWTITREQILNNQTGMKRPSFTQKRDGGDLFERVKIAGFNMPSHETYTNSGYDRGHMCPMEDRDDTQEQVNSTFFIANIWPQIPSLNRGYWLQLEELDRRRAINEGKIDIIIIVEEFQIIPIKEILFVPKYFIRISNGQTVKVENKTH